MTGSDRPPSVLATLRTLAQNADRWASAACAQADPDAWFPETATGSATAKAICADCPLRRACLTDALQTRPPHGIWAGLTYPRRCRLTAELDALLGPRATLAGTPELEAILDRELGPDPYALPVEQPPAPATPPAVTEPSIAA